MAGKTVGVTEYCAIHGGSHDEHVVGVGQEPQRDQVRPLLLVEADRRRVVPGLQLHRRVQVGGLGTAGGGLAVAAGDLVG